MPITTLAKTVRKGQDHIEESNNSRQTKSLNRVIIKPYQNDNFFSVQNSNLWSIETCKVNNFIGQRRKVLAIVVGVY